MNLELERRALGTLGVLLEQPHANRIAAVDALRHDDCELADHVQTLLDAHEKCDQEGWELLSIAPLPNGVALPDPVVIRHASGEEVTGPGGSMIGRRIGRYTIRAALGRGGMGAVFLAAQDEPERLVAVKLLPASMLALSPGALGHFRREIGVLARLGHPNIAVIYEAGTSEDLGATLPYFAMEYVESATTITAFARRPATADGPGVPSLESRLHLLLQACDAVQFGHQRGVIHRDLKPANILVNGQGVVKIIDFGIARLIDSHADEQDDPLTATAAWQGAGTPAYMSPEQCTGDRAAIDVRTDVYALGVVMRELLDDQVPLPVDLRTIVAKATASDRAQRYQSVADLTRDLRRFLGRQPIEARPPSVGYRLRLFMRRRRGLAGGIAAAAVLVVLAIAGTSFGLWRARAAERLARAESTRYQAVSAFLADMFSSPNPSKDGRDVRVLDVLQEWEGRIDAQFAHDPQARAALHEEFGAACMGLGEYERADSHLQDAIAIRSASDGPQAIATQLVVSRLAVLRQRQGRFKESEAMFNQAIPVLLEHGGPEDPDVLTAQNDLALTLRGLGRPDEAERLLQDVVALRLRGAGALNDSTVSSMNNLALLFRERGRLDLAEPLYRQALEIDTRRFGRDHVRTATSMTNLSALLRAQGRLEEAEPLARESLEFRRSELGEDHPDVLLSMNNLAMLLVSKGQLADAERVVRETLAAHRRVLGDDHIGTMIVANNHARLLIDLGRPSEAAEVLEGVVEAARRSLGAEHWRVAGFSISLGSAWSAMGRTDDARAIMLPSFDRLSKSLGSDDPQTQRAAGLIAAMFEARGDREAAEMWRQRSSTAD